MAFIPVQSLSCALYRMRGNIFLQVKILQCPGKSFLSPSHLCFHSPWSSPAGFYLQHLCSSFGQGLLKVNGPQKSTALPRAALRWIHFSCKRKTWTLKSPFELHGLCLWMSLLSHRFLCWGPPVSNDPTFHFADGLEGLSWEAGRMLEKGQEQ